MLITSMGIFGFLSKAHIDSTLNSGANTVELKTINQQEKITKERLDYLLARAKDPSTASGKLDKQIQDTQKDLTEISKKKLPLMKEDIKLSADVGPIKYVAQLIYGDTEDGIDKAVRLVIMIIMVVFDPLAVLLLISANMSMNLKPETGQTGDLIIKKDEIVGVKSSDIPVFTDKVEVEKENITEFKTADSIIIDPVSGETMPPISAGIKTKTLEPKYDYEAPYSFREKGK